MTQYRKGSHTVHKIHLHFVFIPKYRKPVLKGPVGIRVRDLVRQICEANDVVILQGHVRPDHVHLLLSLPPNLAPSRVMQLVKGRTSHKLLREFRHINREFWGRHLWARGYFVASTGNVSDEVVAEYIANQDVERGDDEFKVSE